MTASNGFGRVAMVLAGGGARGAYEVGVAKYILEDVSKKLGRDVPVQIFCGTSVGAINACFLAALADQPKARVRLLMERWRSLRVEHILRLDPVEIVALVREMFGRRPKQIFGRAARGGVLDPRGLEKVLADAIRFERIDEHIAAGRLLAASVSTTHVSTGRTVVFVQHDEQQVPRWGAHATMDRRHVRLRLEHALASAAIPLVFPAVRIDGELYCDGGLRQNVPLSPARRLGADCLVVVNPHHIGPEPEDEELSVQSARGRAFPGPAFVLGKTMNALLLDRVDSDMDRLNRINEILAAGSREYGEGFVDAINRQMGLPVGPGGMRSLGTVLVRASDDIGRLCGEFVRSERFARRVRGVTGRVLRRMANAEGIREADLLSYVLFDGEFASEVMALGEEDARAKSDTLCELFDGALRQAG